jgi:uncharacterized protein
MWYTVGMKLLVISDIHGRTEGLEALRGISAESAALVVNGDLTHFGDAEEAERVVTALKEIHHRVLAVPGNCDNDEAAAVMEAEGISIDGRGERLPPADGNGGGKNMLFYGIGGALPGPVSTPNEYSEAELETRLKEKGQAVSGQGDEPGTGLVLVSHQPPHGTVADRVMKLKHVGSRVLRDWMERRGPLLLLTGHIHESRGYEFYGRSCVVNPGPFKDGCYAVVDIGPEEGDVRVALKSV